jgi:hypothetical protein
MIAFLAVAVFTLLVYCGLVGQPFERFFLQYLPWLIVWLLVDIYKGRKS